MAAYRSTPVFNDKTLPAALRADHRTKAGTWGVINVLAGEFRLTFVYPREVRILSPGCPGMVEPEQTHFVTPIGAMQMRIDFHDSRPDMAVLMTDGGIQS